MTIISWDKVFEVFEKQIESVDIFKWIVYGPVLNVIIGKTQERFPASFKHMFDKKYGTSHEWVKETWKSGTDSEGKTYYRFSEVCDKQQFKLYKFMTQRQKDIFKKTLNESEESYTILDNVIAFAPLNEEE